MSSYRSLGVNKLVDYLINFQCECECVVVDHIYMLDSLLLLSSVLT